MIKEFLKDWRSMGSIMPTSRIAGEALLEPVDFSRARVVVELGPGPGNITRQVLEHLQPGARLIAIEINPEFVERIRREIVDDRLEAICASASDLPSILEQRGLGKADAIISVLPFTSLAEPVRQDIMVALRHSLSSDGVFVAIQYTPLVMPRLIEQHLGPWEVRPCLWNVPPALIYRYPSTQDWTRRRAWHEGLPFVAAGLTVGALTARRSRPLSLLATGFGLACAAFFRDPERPVDASTHDVIAAADGVVQSIEQVEEPWWIGGMADRISVFLSILDVHVTRSPVAGRLVEVKRIPGGYAPAYEKKSESNFRDLLALESACGRVLVAQISGILARRSVQWCPPGQTLASGQRLGMIRFGSRTDVYLPAGAAEILVSAGDRVQGGRTRIARYKSSC
ncbi:MAG: phosphatidylserine decarboxylase [Candidatus Xenobia bacterium]